MAGTKQRITRHGSVYLLGNVLQRAVSFLMLPVYTHYLSPADYGTLELLSMVIDFVSLIFGMQIGDAVFRYYAKYKDPSEKHEVITTSMLLVLLMNIAGVLLIWAAADPLSRSVLGSSEHAGLLMLFSLTILSQSLISVPMVFLKARQKSFTFLGFSMAKLIMQLSLNIYFIVFLGMKVEGVIYSALITGAVMSVIMSSYTFFITGLHFSPSKAKELIRFSVPLIGAAVLSFYFTFGDRYFLQLYIGNDAVGIYSLAYRFGFLLPFLIVGPFASIWNAEMYHVAKRENGIATFQKVFFLLSTAMIFFTVSISVFIKEILMVMSAPPFWPAAQVVPLIMGAYLFQGWTWFGSLGILIKEKTIERTYANILCVIIITPGYLFLIPHYGAMGAALATFLAFAARCFYLNWRAKKLFDMQLPWRSMIPASALSIGAVLLSMTGPESLVPALLFDVTIMLAYTILFFLLPILPKELKKAIGKILLNPRNAISLFRQ